MSKPFYMKLYWGEYHGGTRHLRTAAEHGAYLLLIGALFSAGGKLRADDEILARHACCTADEWAAMKPILMPFFQLRRGAISHKRVSEELAKAEAKMRQTKAAGRRGSEATNGKTKASGAANAEGPPQRSPTESESESESPKPKKASGRGSRRCPADWWPDQALIAWATSAGSNGELGLPPYVVRRELAAFKDYEFSRPRSDWPATFANWLRKTKERFDDRDRPDRADAKQSARHANFAAAQRGAEIAARRLAEDD